jgi:hypothetical protein
VALDHRAARSYPRACPRKPVGPEGAPRGRLLPLIVAPIALLDPAAFVARLAERTAPGPGLGLFNLLAYRGAEASAGALVLAALAPLLLAGLVLWLLRRPWPPLAVGGIASLGGIALAPAISPEAVAVPVMLLGLAAMEGVGEPASNDNGPTDTSL